MEPQFKRLLGFAQLAQSESATTVPSLSNINDLEGVIQFIQSHLKQIMKSMLEEKKQYERSMALSLQQMQVEYEAKLEDKDRLISELSCTIDSLISNSKAVELELSRKLSDSQQEIQTYKNMLRRKYLKEIDQQRKMRRDTARQHTNSPSTLKKVLSTLTEGTYHSPQSYRSPNSHSTRKPIELDMQTRASTLADRTSQLLSALKLRSNISKKSAVVGKTHHEQDSSITTINSTILPGRINSNSEIQLA